jgi:hypothetical protein
MPLSPNDLPAIRSATARLIGTLEVSHPDVEAFDRALHWAKEEFVSTLHPGSALHPSSAKDRVWRYTDITDITESALNGDVQLVLLNLREFVLNGAFDSKAARERKATIAHLKRLYADLKGRLTPSDKELKGTKKKILALVRRRPLKGEAIANEVGLCYEYTRRLLGQMSRDGYLTNDDKGYHAARWRG